jgi:NAD(P)-dependent dehydrogenase (short-subunit alcohol dehydrogenase family)
VFRVSIGTIQVGDTDGPGKKVEIVGRLEDKVACISGVGGSGQGQAAARLFAREGAKVVACDLDPDAVDRFAAAVESEGLEILVTTADVTDDASVETWISEAVERYDAIDVLYNHAAYTSFELIEVMPIDAWRKAVLGELDAVFLPCKFALPHMIRQGCGSIVNTASISGLISTELPGLVGGMAHAAGKAGVCGFTRSLAQEYAKHGIRANAICPGAVDLGADSPELQQQERLRRIPLGRMGRPEEFAYTALFLASDESSYITGQSIVVDGGWTIF